MKSHQKGSITVEVLPRWMQSEGYAVFRPSDHDLIPGKLDAVKAMCEEFVEMTKNEEKCLYYGMSFNGDQVHCREGYTDADGALAHLQNVGAKLQEFLKIADLTRLELHGPAEELEKLRGPLSDFKPQLFVLEFGFRR